MKGRTNMTKQHDDDKTADLYDKPKADKKEEKSTYSDDPTDPNYVEPRLRPGWTPDKPG
jgi:hypothetical protein